VKIFKPLAFRWRSWRAVRQTEREIRAEDRAERKAARPAGPAPASLRVPRALALAGISVLVGAASLTSFAESYRGLYDWSHEHGLSGLWAAVWPLQVDVFIAVGELALFVALADSWRTRSRVGAWLVTLGGLAVSVAGNVGHVHSALVTNRATAAVPPLAAAAALAVGLGVLKRVVAGHAVPGVPAAVPDEFAGLNGYRELAAGLFAADLEAGAVPGIRAIRSGLHVGQDKATEVQAYLRTLTRTP
jgi:hypothetical protein